MKIAILHHCLDVKSGAERQVLQLSVGLQEKGHEVTIYVSKLNTENCFPELINKVKIVECGGYGYKDIKKSILFSPYYMRQMAKMVLNSGTDYDLINCHNFPTIYAAQIIKKKKGKPIVWMCNEPPFPPIYYGQKKAETIRSWIYRLMMAPFLIYNQKIVKNMDQIVVLDQMNLERIKLTYNRTPVIVHTGLDFPKSNKVVDNPETDSDHFVVLAAGRIDKGKRTEDAIKAVTKLKDRIPNILLKIAGDGRLLKKMKQLASQLNLNNYIKFYSRVSDEKLRELYASCDVFLFTAENQSWGLVPLEAMSYGKPCIVSTGTGVSYILEDKNNCLKIDPRDVKSIAGNVIFLYENPKLSDNIAKSGEKFVRENFSWERYVKGMERILSLETKITQTFYIGGNFN